MRGWEVAVMAVEATTAAMRNNSNDIREMAKRALREFEARVGALPWWRTIRKKPMKKIWIDGKVKKVS